jgi:drug/metabolite transporter (DMT)-like permease
MVLLGEGAAVMTSVLWTICSILFASAGKRIGVFSVNAYRIVMAAGLLSAAHLLVMGSIIPEANKEQWFYLIISGIIGLALGDFAYFSALVYLGPRKGVLMMATAPIFSVVSAVFILDEIPGIWSMLGISVTLTGVMIVIYEKEGHSFEPPLSKRTKITGVVMGFGGALGQGLGLVISKYGMDNAASPGADTMDPLSASLIRMVAAGIFIWIVVVLSGRTREIIFSARDRKGMEHTAGGAFFGPFLGVWMSMVAIAHALAGVAATLMSLAPVMIIPVLWLLYKQKTNWRGIFGAVIAVIGVSILFLT